MSAENLVSVRGLERVTVTTDYGEKDLGIDLLRRALTALEELDRVTQQLSEQH